jgi:HPt (histidine-containing phosphotransfer) domain-containing protein
MTDEEGLMRMDGEVDMAGFSSTIFDRKDFLERLMGDQALVKTVIEGFLADMPGQMAVLREHVAVGMAEKAGTQAHKIKGAAANVGAGEFRETAAAMEAAGKEGDLERLAGLMPELEERFGRLKSVMEYEINTDT